MAKDLASTFGIAVTVCILIIACIFFFIWKVLNWAREDIIKPGMTRHLLFMDGLETTIKTQTTIQQQQSDNCKRQVELLEAMRSEIALLRSSR